MKRQVLHFNIECTRTYIDKIIVLCYSFLLCRSLTNKILIRLIIELVASELNN